MSKLTKLINHPDAFFIDALKKRVDRLQVILADKSQSTTPIKNVKPTKPKKLETNTERQQSKVDHNDIKQSILDQIDKIHIHQDADLNILLFNVDRTLEDVFQKAFDTYNISIQRWMSFGSSYGDLNQYCEQQPYDFVAALSEKLFSMVGKKVVVIFLGQDQLAEKLTIVALKKFGIPTVLLSEDPNKLSSMTDFLIVDHGIVGDEWCERILKIEQGFLSSVLLQTEIKKTGSPELIKDLIGFDLSDQVIYIDLHSVEKWHTNYAEYSAEALQRLDQFLSGVSGFRAIIDVGDLSYDFSMLSNKIFVNGVQESIHLDVYQALSIADFCFSSDVSRLNLSRACGCQAYCLDNTQDGLSLTDLCVSLLQESDGVKIQVDAKENIQQIAAFLLSISNIKYKPIDVKSFSLIEGVDHTVAYAAEFGEKAYTTTHQYLPALMGVEQIKQSNPKLNNVLELIDVDCFLQWGIKDTETKKWQRRVARTYGKPVLIIEDGFIRSIDIGLSGEPGLSVLLDDKTAYYNAKEPSRMEMLIQNAQISELEIERARSIIQMIVKNRVSKYNHAPNLSLKIGREGYPKILLVDQRFGDQSVEYGLASEKAFDKMLQDAISNYSGYDIIVKQHPDAIKGGKSSYFSDEKLAFAKYTDNIFPINFDVNPYALFDLVDEVFVGTSGMGFEALLAGKKVTCYGMPFYAGWGLTNDKLTIARRTQKRSVEEVFFIAYVLLSRYFSPKRENTCTIEELIADLVDIRGW